MTQHQDPISAMIRLGRAPEEPSVAGQDQARAAAREVWLGSVHRRKRQRAISLIAAVLLAALGALGLVLGLTGEVTQSGPLADLERIVGDIEVDSLAWNDSGERRIALGSGSVLETAVKGRASLRLNNGSRVRLDSATRIRLSGDRRLELESGALYFDSAPTVAQQPRAAKTTRRTTASKGATASRVEVRTALATLTNQGTSYEVRISAAELTVAVRSGSVLVEPRRAPGTKVKAGQILRLTSSGTSSVNVLAPNDPRFAWTLPLVEPFDIDGRTVGEFLDWVRWESGIEIRLGAGVEPDLLETRLRGDVVWTSPEEAIIPTLELVGSRVRFGQGLVVIER